MFSFHQVNMAKCSKSDFSVILFSEKILDKISLDLIKPWQTLGYCGSES